MVWESKKNLAVWRGLLTGLPVCDLRALREKTEVEKCLCYTRCAFVHNHRQSKIIDAALSGKAFMERRGVTEDHDSVKVGGMDMKTQRGRDGAMGAWPRRRGATNLGARYSLHDGHAAPSRREARRRVDQKGDAATIPLAVDVTVDVARVSLVSQNIKGLWDNPNPLPEPML